MPVTVFGSQRGLGLVELLVGIVISLIVMAGTIFVFIGNSESSLLFMRSTRSSQVMRDSMDRIVQDIRRAGYMGWRYMADPTVTVGPDDNWFSEYDWDDDADEVGIRGTTLAMFDCDADGLCAGVTYAYNLDNDGTNDVNPPQIGEGPDGGCEEADATIFDSGPLEWFGFRFHDRKIQQLRTRTSCERIPSEDDWVDITDPALVDIGNIGAAVEDRVGFLIEDQCVGLIDNAGAGGVGPPDGDVFQEEDGVAGLTCADLYADAANTLDPCDFEVRTRRVRIQLAGRTASPDPATGSVSFKLSQVVDLPNYAARLVPAAGACP